MDKTTRIISENAIVAAIYFVLTIACAPFSFGLINFRISEILMLLCFFRKDYIIGIAIGCMLSNLAMSGTMLGGLGWVDMLIGSSATLIAGLIMPYCKRLFIASLMPVITNGILVGLELCYLYELGNLYVCMGFVALGELVVVSIVGYTIVLIFKKKYKNFDRMLNANINLDVRW